MDVVDNDGLSLRDRGATDTLIERNAVVRCRSANKRAQDKGVLILGIENVEAHPVVIRHSLREGMADGGHQDMNRRRATGG